MSFGVISIFFIFTLAMVSVGCAEVCYKKNIKHPPSY